MSSSKQNVTVGFFVVVSILLLGLLTVWFGEQPDWLKRMTGGATYALHISFDDLSDVEAGTELRMAIGRVGQVTEVRYWEPESPGVGVDVVVEIREDVSVPSNAVALVQPSSMFGRAFILLTHPSETTVPVPKDGTGRITGKVAGVLDNVVPRTIIIELEKATVAIGNLADALNPVARDLHDLLGKRPAGLVDDPPMGQRPLSANFSTAVERFDTLIKHGNTVLGDPETQSLLKETVVNFHQMSVDGKLAVQRFREFSEETRQVVTEVRQVLKGINQSLEGADRNMLRMTSELVQVTDQLGEVILQLEKASTALTEGEGTAAHLMNDNRLYEEMVLTFQRLSAAAEEFEKTLAQIREKGLKTRF